MASVYTPRHARLKHKDDGNNHVDDDSDNQAESDSLDCDDNQPTFDNMNDNKYQENTVHCGMHVLGKNSIVQVE